MWCNIGPSRLVLVLLVIPLGFFLGRHGRPWMAALGPLAFLAALAPGYDPITMLLALALLIPIFRLGVFGAGKWLSE